MLIDSLEGGGAERSAVGLASYLADKGWLVTIVTLKPIDSDFYEVHQRVGRCSLDLSSGGGIFKRALINLRRVTALRRILKQESPAAMVGMMTACSILAIIAAIGTPIRVIVSERNNPLRKNTRAAWKWLRKYLYRFADAHVAQTRDTARWLTKNVKAGEIRVIPNAVSWPLAAGKPVRDPVAWLRHGDRCVLAVGTKWYQKGFDLLVDAFAEAADSGAEWKLVIAGIESSDGKNDDPVRLLTERAERLGIGDRIHFPGMVGNISDWYEQAEIFALSSRYEGYPNVLMEAMAAGCACIAFDCDTGPADVVSTEVDGLLVKPEDTGALSAGLKRLMEDPGLRSRLAENAVEVRARYAEERVFEQWLNLLEKLRTTRPVSARCSA